MKSGKQNFSQSTKSSDPTPAVEGQMYYDIGIHAFRYYNGTTWLTLGTGGSSGTIVKTQFAEDDTVITPFTGSWTDGSKLPQITFGYNYTQLNTAFGTYTPLAGTNKLFVEGYLFGYATVGGNSPAFQGALFKNSDADAIACNYSGAFGGSSSAGAGLYMATVITPGSTSPISFTMRAGSYNSNGSINVCPGFHKGKSWLRVTEYLP